MSISETEVINIKFENFIHTQENEDLFEKTRRVDKILKSGILTGNEALGMISLNKLSPIMKLKEKDGFCHNHITSKSISN